MANVDRDPSFKSEAAIHELAEASKRPNWYDIIATLHSRKKTYLPENPNGCPNACEDDIERLKAMGEAEKREKMVYQAV